MSIAAIGIFMLIIVLLFYGRMISERNPARRAKSQTEEILERVAVFESLAKDAEALAYLEKELESCPEDEQLVNKKKALSERLKS